MKADLIIHDLREALESNNFVHQVDGALYKYDAITVSGSLVKTKAVMRDTVIECGYDGDIQKYYFTLLKGGLKTYDTADEMVKYLKTFLYVNTIIIPDAKLVAEKASTEWGISVSYAGVKGFEDTGYKVMFKVLGTVDFLYVYQEDEDKTLYTATLLRDNKAVSSEKFSVTGNLTIDTYVDALYRKYADTDDYDISRDSTNTFSVAGNLQFKYILEIRDNEYVACVHEPVEIELVGDYACDMLSIEDAINTLLSANDTAEDYFSDEEEVVEVTEEEVTDSKSVDIPIEENVDEVQEVIVMDGDSEVKQDLQEDVVDLYGSEEEVDLLEESTNDVVEEELEVADAVESDITDLPSEEEDFTSETEGCDSVNEMKDSVEETIEEPEEVSYVQEDSTEEITVAKASDDGVYFTDDSTIRVQRVYDSNGSFMKYEIETNDSVLFIPLDVADTLGLTPSSVIAEDYLTVKNGICLTGAERRLRKFGKTLSIEDIDDSILNMLF